MAIELVDLEKLSHSQVALTAAYRAGMPMQECGWMRYPAACWDKPAIVAMASGACVAGLNFTEEDDELTVRVDFAWCDPSHPAALAMILSRFRKRYAGGRFTELRFTCHDGNDAMAKAVRVLRLAPFSRTYRMALG